MIEVREGLCCGLAEISGIAQYRTASDVLEDIVIAVGYTTPFIIFTTAASNKKPVAYGERLVQGIEKNKLGYVTKSDPRLSHTGNYVTVYIWHVDRKALDAYRAKINND